MVAEARRRRGGESVNDGVAEVVGEGRAGCGPRGGAAGQGLGLGLGLRSKVQSPKSGRLPHFLAMMPQLEAQPFLLRLKHGYGGQVRL